MNNVCIRGVGRDMMRVLDAHTVSTSAFPALTSPNDCTPKEKWLCAEGIFKADSRLLFDLYVTDDDVRYIVESIKEAIVGQSPPPEITDMVINQALLDSLSEQAKANPRLRQAMDLRNSVADGSKRMLNVLEPGTVMPIHRHNRSSEACVCIRGHFEEYFYDSEGQLTETIDMVSGGAVLNIEAEQWHSLKCLESGTVLLEAKDGGCAPLGPEDILTV